MYLHEKARRFSILWQVEEFDEPDNMWYPWGEACYTREEARDVRRKAITFKYAQVKHFRISKFVPVRQK